MSCTQVSTEGGKKCLVQCARQNWTQFLSLGTLNVCTWQCKYLLLPLASMLRSTIPEHVQSSDPSPTLTTKHVACAAFTSWKAIITGFGVCLVPPPQSSFSGDEQEAEIQAQVDPINVHVASPSQLLHMKRICLTDIYGFMEAIKAS